MSGLELFFIELITVLISMQKTGLKMKLGKKYEHVPALLLFSKYYRG
jgi:hypothetical protein